jgi:hypothetical protein
MNCLQADGPNSDRRSFTATPLCVARALHQFQFTVSVRLVAAKAEVDIVPMTRNIVDRVTNLNIEEFPRVSKTPQ